MGNKKQLLIMWAMLGCLVLLKLIAHSIPYDLDFLFYVILVVFLLAFGNQVILYLISIPFRAAKQVNLMITKSKN
jgi:hypothetical protein